MKINCREISFIKICGLSQRYVILMFSVRKFTDILEITVSYSGFGTFQSVEKKLYFDLNPPRR